MAWQKEEGGWEREGACGCVFYLKKSTGRRIIVVMSVSGLKLPSSFYIGRKLWVISTCSISLSGLSHDSSKVSRVLREQRGRKKKSFPGPIHEETTTEAVDNVNAGIYQWHSISTSPTSIDQTSGWRTVDELATRSFRLPGPCDLTSKWKSIFRPRKDVKVGGCPASFFL